MQGISTASQSALTPARKRPRTSSFDDADGDITLIEETDSSKIVRDSEYYKTSGDCRIRVEDTLFCIHRFLLERDSSTFQTMFQLPQGGEKPQGSTDEDPIVLVGDTVGQFRALCWALYALPDDIAQESDGKSMEKLANVAIISHKYQLAAFQAWAMASIRRRCNKNGLSGFWAVAPYLHGCPSNLLPTFLRLSILYGDDALKNRVIDAWVFRLGLSTLSFFGLPVSAFSDAFLSAKENQLRQFLGKLYYARLNIAYCESASSPKDFPFEGLELLHFQRIFRGSWSLSAYWQRLISPIPELPKDRCQHHTSDCLAQWRLLWGQGGGVGAATDILRKLNWIRKSLCSDGVVEALGESCADKGSAIVTSLIKQVEETLPDYFLGPP